MPSQISIPIFTGNIGNNHNFVFMFALINTLEVPESTNNRIEEIDLGK